MKFSILLTLNSNSKFASHISNTKSRAFDHLPNREQNFEDITHNGAFWTKPKVSGDLSTLVIPLYGPADAILMKTQDEDIIKVCRAGRVDANWSGKRRPALHTSFVYLARAHLDVY